MLVKTIDHLLEKGLVIDWNHVFIIFILRCIEGYTRINTTIEINANFEYLVFYVCIQELFIFGLFKASIVRSANSNQFGNYIVDILLCSMYMCVRHTHASNLLSISYITHTLV